MRELTFERFARSVVGVVGAAGPTAMITLGIGMAAAAPQPAQPDPSGAARVELGTTKRDCDFNPVGAPGTGNGSGFAIISTTSSEVSADVNLANAAPTAAYNVRLILLPSLTCGPGAAGVAQGTLQTNQAGDGTITLQTDLIPTATGAWVMVFDDGLGQLYTSNTVAPVGTGPLTTRPIDSRATPGTP